MSFLEDNSDLSRLSRRCVGVGACRKTGVGTMCPSYMATLDEEHSTRGRARLLFEMSDGKIVHDRWRSKSVHDALDLCLACKACKRECPVHVDMASYKAEFMHHHFRGRVRPRAAYAMGLIWWWARMGSHAPSFVNTMLRLRPSASIAKAIAGFSSARTIPELAPETFRGWFFRRARKRGPRGRVLLWADTFNTYFTPGPLQAATRLLEDTGFEVALTRKPVCCGRPLYAFGMLDLADRLWSQVLEEIKEEIAGNTPIVGIEPACVSAFRDELPRMRPRDMDARRLSSRVQHLSEFLLAHNVPLPPRQGKVTVHAHCHHRAVLRPECELEVLRSAGFEAELADNGCCGMAGDYGFRRESAEIAARIAQTRFLPWLRATGGAIPMADGYSCREQARQHAGLRLATLPELLAGSGTSVF